MSELTATINNAIAEVLLLFENYDDGKLTREDTATRVRFIITSVVNGTWDKAFTMGVQEARLDEDGDDETIDFDFDDRGEEE